MITYKKVKILNGKEVLLFRLSNSANSYVEILNYGATIVSIVVPDKNNKLENIILTYDDPEDYFTDNAYLGSTIGRFANRISNAQFKFNEQTYYLDKNDGKNSNHGGFDGFNSRIFDYTIDENSVLLFLESKEGEGGFPGNMTFSVRYSFSDDHKLTIEYRASTDRETIFNPTNHAYFNLSAGREDALNHELKIVADQYLESTDAFIPTGNLLAVENTAFDFRDFKNIGTMSRLKKEILQGYNTYFIGRIKKSEQKLQHWASLREIRSGREVEVHSTMPGIMLYTGDYLSHPFQPFQGLCLEAQFYPDSPNQPGFPSCTIHPGEEFVQQIQYAFTLINNQLSE